MRIPLGRYFTLLKTYLKPQWWSVLLLAVTLFVGIGLQLLNPQILAFFINTSVQDGATSTLLWAGLAFIGVALANQGLAIVTTYLTTHVAWTATNQLRVDLVEHCLNLDMSFYKTRSAGEMIERIDGDINALSNFFSKLVVELLSSLILLTGILVLFFVIDVRVGIVMTLFSVITFSILLYLRSQAVPLWKELRERWTHFFGFLGERLVGTEDIRANGATTHILRSFYQSLRSLFDIYMRARLKSAQMFVTTLFLFICGSALALSMGLYLWSQGVILVGTVYILFSYTDLLTQPLQRLQEQFQDLQQAEASIQRIEELRATSSVLPEGSGVTLSSGALSIDFEHVTFGYVAEEPVLHDITFSVSAGRTLGILGRTGSGKTTLARLLFRLYDAQEGTVRVGGLPVQAPYLRALRRHIGMVTQDVQLFQASVRDNLTFFNPTIPDERILAALNEIGLTTWYQSLPDGLDTILGTSGQGMGLSAGQAQLLAFARVLLTNPGLVILDEASSRLDPATENLVERAISALFADRSALVIAHRLSTVQRVDDILIIEDGRIVEYGPRADLAQDPASHFSRLLHTGHEDVVLALDSEEPALQVITYQGEQSEAAQIK